MSFTTSEFLRKSTSSYAVRKLQIPLVTRFVLLSGTNTMRPPKCAQLCKSSVYVCVQEEHARPSNLSSAYQLEDPSYHQKPS